MAAPSVTYTFTNGTTADATQVNTNFTDLINGASDGTKDYTINTLTVNGAASFNGAVTLGNASGDALTFTGSLASSVAISTNATYNFGGSTTGLLSLYLGNNTRTTRLVAGTITTSYTITLPPATASAGQIMAFDANSSGTFRYADKFTASKTTAYTATGDETIIPCDASSAAFTVTLPAASTMTGKQLKIIKTDSTLNAVTIDGNASETINGATTTTINTQYECLTIACDSSGWSIINRYIPAKTTSYTPTGNMTTAATYTGMWWRKGDRIYCQARIAFSGNTDGVATTMSIPSGLTIDTAKLLTTTVNEGNFGTASFYDSGLSHDGIVAYASNTTVGAIGDDGAGGWSNTLPATVASGDSIEFNFNVPISGWNG
jgi:hypothetical protein